MENNPANLKIHPKVIFKALLYVIGLLVTLNLVVLFIKFEFGHPSLFGISWLFYLDLEGNIPTWFSSFLILACSAVMTVISSANKSNGNKSAFYWGSLALLFLFLSVDESAGMHELFIIPLRNLLNATGVFYFAWVIPAFGFLIFCFGFYWRFLFSLPRIISSRMVLAAFIYIGGALGMEMVTGAYWSYNSLTESTRSLTYEILVIVEEVLEMTGMAFFLYVLLDYAASIKIGFNFIVDRRTDKKRSLIKQEQQVGYAN